MTEADAQTQVDERRIARAFALGLPAATVAVALAMGLTLGPPTAILVLAAGGLLGVIALFWASLRILAGDAALSPEIEALDTAAHGVDMLASRKKMLLVALKDLENERALGKLDDEDYTEVAETYRTELKAVLKRIDATLEPYREKAEEVARTHLAQTGVIAPGYRGVQPSSLEGVPEPAPSVTPDGTTRVACAKCAASNEPDAKFCKGCGAVLGEASADAN